MRRQTVFALAVAIMVSVSGCSRAPAPAPQDSEKAPAASAEKKSNSLLAPFTPPAWSEIESAKWVDMPVRDAAKDLRAELAESPSPTTPEEALALTNDSAEANTKILAALGRPPADPKEVDWNATWNRRMGGEVRSTNALLISSVSEFDLQGFINAGLISFDRRLSPFADAATCVSWQTSEDRLMDKIVLRDDLTWSDGKPVTAHDIAFSFQVIMDERVPVPAVRSGTDELRWVHAYDDRTIVYFHKESKATNVWNIAFPFLPKHLYESSYVDDPTLAKSDRHVELENNPVCCGAYTIARRQRGGEIVLKRREGFYLHQGKEVREKPYFDTIRFRIIEDSNTALLAIKSGNIDETNLIPEQWVKQTQDDEFTRRNTKVKETEWTSWHVCWNLKSPFFSDLRVRRAMAYAFDYEELLGRLAYGLYEPSSGSFHRGSWMAPKEYPSPYKQDLDKAEALLEEAGWTDSDGDGIRDKDGRPFQFTLSYRSDPVLERYCNVMRESLDKIGIECRLGPIEFTVLQQRMLDHNFDASFGGWGTGADPDTFRNIMGSGEERNFGSYSNPQVDELFKQAAREFDRSKRGELYGKIHSILFEEQPYLYLYWRASFYAFNKELRGYVMSPRGPFNYSPGASAIWRVAAP